MANQELTTEEETATRGGIYGGDPGKSPSPWCTPELQENRRQPEKFLSFL